MRFHFYFLSLLLIVSSACQKDTPAPPAKIPSYIVSTLAGTSPGTADGVGAAAQFSGPCAMAVDAQGTLYVVDRSTHRIRTVNSAGVVRTLAGGGSGVGINGGSYADGQGADARFNYPQGIAVDAQGMVYVADTFNNRIRKITPTGTVSTLAGSGEKGFADGPSSTAQFSAPFGVAVDAQGMVYVADYGNERIRKISPTGIVSTLAGSGTTGHADGAGSEAQFHYPYDLAVDGEGTLYVTDHFAQYIRKVTATGVVSTLAGTGQEGFQDGPGAQFNYPRGIDVDAQGTVYVADTFNNRIRNITPKGVVGTLAGTGEAGSIDGHSYEATFDSPEGIAVGARGEVYVTDWGTNRIRVITPQ